MTALNIVECGPATSVQDGGRRGYLRFGITTSGAADIAALAAANILVGNPTCTAGLELVITGGTFEVSGGRARLALAGARMPLSIDGRAVPDHTSFLLSPGERLRVGAAREGVYSMLAVEGGFDLPPVMESRSFYRRALVGAPLLQAGSVLPLALGEPSRADNAAMPPLPLATTAPLRTVPGPQRHMITDGGWQTFLAGRFEVSTEVDRMACRLSGPRIELVDGYNIVSDGIALGSIQVPGSGQPIVMLADRQTIGGYPKVATLITPDIRYLAQTRPGGTISFTAVTVDEAEDAARLHARWMSGLANDLRPALSPTFDSSRLMLLNVAGHASSAADPATWPA